jgi:3-oxoacyl-[acyl-carrier protein] reductase
VVHSTIERFGSVDILINNMGASVGGAIASTEAGHLRLSFQVNVEIPFLLTKAALPYMEQSRFGRVVMLASIYGREVGGKLPYNAAKAAETSLAKGLAREVASKGITVNSVAPGSIRYPGGSWDRRVEADPEGMADWVKSELPLGRFGAAKEVATVVAFLCSPRASLVNGASIVVDGGQGRSNL